MEIAGNNFSHWQLPQRQSPAAIFIILGKISIQLLKAMWPVVVLYFFKDQKDEDSLWILWAVAAFGAMSLVGTFISYWFRKFYISENHLIITSGWLNKKHLSIPFQNIQSVQLEQNVWQQLMGVSKVSLDATGSEKVEVQLDAVATEKAMELKKLLMHSASANVNQTAGENSNKLTYKLGFGALLKLSLTANHIEAFFILLIFGLNLMGEIKRLLDFDGQEYLNTYAREVIGQTTYLAFILLLLITFVSILFSFIRTFLKYFDFSLVESDNSWRITHGLFNRQQKTIPLAKIQVISWRTSWLRRKIDYWILQVQSVGHGNQAKKQYVQIPILAFSDIVNLAENYQEYNGIDPAASHALQEAYWQRKALLLGLPLAIVPMLVSWYWIEWWAFGFILPGAYITGHYYAAWRNFRWQTVPAGLQLVSGVWGRKYTLLNWNKVQQVHIHQSPYQQRNGLANVLLYTAGGKVELPYLTLDTATKVTDQALYEVESKEAGWM